MNSWPPKVVEALVPSACFIECRRGSYRYSSQASPQLFLLLILFVGDFFHPNDNLAIELLLISLADHPSARVDADLISTTGVPSNTSIGPIFTPVPLISCTVTGCSPSGFGRAGDRV
jgi:hypothetical protein